ncbi:MAG TPA: hypothetical protein VME17_13425 [Bryobacteraceae bacterium]|nr:hypothetical protein [Bryobacteraceae bacterium]
MNLIPYFVLWSLLAVAVLALALYRKLITIHGDDEFVHLAAGEEKLIPHQVALGRRLEFVDRWGKLLTICTAAFGLLIAAVFLFQAWQASFQFK